MSRPSLPDGSNWSSRWQLNKESNTTLYHGLRERERDGIFSIYWQLLWEIILAYCSSSHRWRHRSPLSGHTCWSWRCSLHLGTETDRRSTAWLIKHKGDKGWGGWVITTLQCIVNKTKELFRLEPLNSLLQKVSSELSSQSSFPLHQELCGTQRPFTQRL